MEIIKRVLEKIHALNFSFPMILFQGLRATLYVQTRHDSFKELNITYGNEMLSLSVYLLPILYSVS